MVKLYHKHVVDGTEIRIDYVPYSNCYQIYQNGEFVESLDGWDSEDKERLKQWERL